jgi:hypothetical protein
VEVNILFVAVAALILLAVTSMPTVPDSKQAPALWRQAIDPRP